jgi:phosphate transport system permease protein
METVLKILTYGAICLAVGVLGYIVLFVLFKGVPHLRLSLFSLKYTSENVSLLPALASTLILIVLSLIITIPIGVLSAVWMHEYASHGNRVVQLVRVAAQALAGIPSIVYGLFGMLFFVTFLGWGYCLLSGACTISLMILPLIMRSSEEALRAVPDIWREGSYGLGAQKLRTVFKIVLPAASPGILAGVILATGRIAGETSALIFTAGTVAQIPFQPMMSARSLAVHMYSLSSEGLHTGESYATGVVLLVLVILINWIATRVAKKIGGQG